MRITAGEWAAGDRLPSETDLAARYGVPRMTACEPAARLLELEPGSPVLRITRTTYDGANRPVEFAMSAMRPGAPIETMMEHAAGRRELERAPAGHPAEPLSP